jgi:hypothetical protein
VESASRSIKLARVLNSGIDLGPDVLARRQTRQDKPGEIPPEYMANNMADTFYGAGTLFDVGMTTQKLRGKLPTATSRPFIPSVLDLLHPSRYIIYALK